MGASRTVAHRRSCSLALNPKQKDVSYFIPLCRFNMLPDLTNGGISKVPVTIHYSKNDPFRNDGFIATLSESIKKSGSKVEYFEYEHGGHLFTDEDFRDYDQQSAQKLIKNVSWFLESI